MTINKSSHKGFLFGKALQLTPTKFSIFWCENQGKAVSTEELFEAVWDEKYMDNNNMVMAHIGHLREKRKERAKNPKFIKTVWGIPLKNRMKTNYEDDYLLFKNKLSIKMLLMDGRFPSDYFGSLSDLIKR